jgi:hypothetical protein
LDFDPEPVRAANCVPSRAEYERILEAIAKNTLPESMEGVQGVLDLRAKEDDFVLTLRVSGRKTVLEDMSIGDRELKFRIGTREYRLKVHAGMMSGSFSAPGGPEGRVVGLR